MDFLLTEEQKQLQVTMRDFVAKEIIPIADKMDEAQEFPMDCFKKLAKLGITGMDFPKEYGGSGGNLATFVVALEELARGWASIVSILDTHLCLATRPIYRFGTEEQKRKFVVPQAKGEKVASFALTEPEAGSDISVIQTTATKKDDAYILNGTKTFIMNGNVCDTVIVFATIDKSLGYRGITAFIVEKGTPGFSVSKKFDKLGMRASTTAELVFEDCRIPAQNLLGEEGRGLRVALSTLDEARIGMAAQAVGLAHAVLDASIKRAKERVQFGRPIAEQEAIQWMLADMSVRLDAARLLTYKAAYLCDQGQPFTKESSTAKLFASEAAMLAATQGIQIHGGYGYMMDSPMQRYFRDAKLIEIYEGTSEVQRIVISRAILA